MHNAIVRQSALLAMAVALLAPMVACGGSDEAQSAEATVQAITGYTPGSGNTVCPFVTAAQLEAILQVSVHLSQTSNNTDQCDWDSPDDPDGIVTVTVVGGDYWEKPSLAPSYKELSGIGREAYVLSELGGWKAGALLEEDKVIVVQVDVTGETEAMAVELLKTVRSNIKAQ